MAGEFTGNSLASFPYSLASKEDQSIYSVESAPEGFSLGDPDHIKTFHIEALYRHWLDRQRKGLQPFVILNSSPQHGSSKKSQKSSKDKGKKKIEWVDVGDDVDEMEDSEAEELDQGDVEMKSDEQSVDQDSTDGSQISETASALKFGPPTGKAKLIRPLTQQPEDSPPVAGPSKLPLPKQLPKKKIEEKSKPGKGEKKERKMTNGKNQVDKPKKLPNIDLSKKLGRRDLKAQVSFPPEVSKSLKAWQADQHLPVPD
jgi:hypothetical protein